jgi:hypothetical protein
LALRLLKGSRQPEQTVHSNLPLKGFMMNSKALLAVAAFAAVASMGARADEADSSQYALKFDGARTRAEVMAEAATVPATRSTEPAGSRVAPALQSTVDVKTVRAQAAQALKLGQISYGEVGRM